MAKRRKFTILEVTMKRQYFFEEGSINGWETEKVIKDWFKDTNINESHATRDGHRIGNSDSVLDIKVRYEDGK